MTKKINFTHQTLFHPKSFLKETFFWICIVAITVVAILNAGIPYATSQILNTALSGDFQKSMVWVMIMLGLIVSLLLFESFSQYFVVRFKNRMILKVKEALTIGLSQLDSHSFQRKKSAYYLSVYNNDLKTIEDDFYQKVLDVYQGIIGIAANASVLFLLDSTLMIVVLVASLVPLATPFLMKKRLSKLQKSSSDAVKTANYLLEDFINGFPILQNYGAMANFRKKLSFGFIHANQAKEKYQKYNVSANIFSGIAHYASFIVTIIVGAYRISAGLTTVGVVTATVQISDNLIYPINLVSEHSKDLFSTKGLRNELDQLGAESIAVKGIREHLTMKDQHAIELKHLSLEVKEKRLFDHLHLTFEHGKKYLISGPSGVGKSTLLKVISGDIRNYDGCVYVDEAIKNAIRVVYQDTYLFHAPVQKNITMFSTLEKERLEQTLHEVNIHELVDSREEEIGQFSGGERQRINVARALYAMPKVLILDEATSALDQKNYQKIEWNLLTHFDGTVISVSHREDEDMRKHYDVIITFDQQGKVTVNHQ